jgi:hypothetical protein
MATKKASKKRAKAGKVTRGGKGLQLPSGFKAISGGGMAQTWDYMRQKTLVGTIKSFHTVASSYKDDKGKPKKQRNAVVEQKGGEQVTVWESAGTRPVFDLKKGAKIAIVFRGLVKIKGRKEPMKDFQVGVA